MKRFFNTCRSFSSSIIWRLAIITFFIVEISSNASYAQNDGASIYKTGESALSAEIQHQLAYATAEGLYFPKSVRRFYADDNFQQVWLKPQNGTGPAWQAMMMIDCVLQFGLAHADYHPEELRYDLLHQMLDHPATIDARTQARFEIMLTDAMINLINNLHYGKLNPYYSNAQIDEGSVGAFSADIVLAKVIQQQNIMTGIESIQPTCQAYTQLQHYLKYRVGLQSGDCYEVPEAEIRKIAINLERYRWAAIADGPVIQINIPTYLLTLYEPDSVYYYRVIVGKPGSPTPALNSAIISFTTCPDRKVPDEIFRGDILPSALADTNYLKNSHFAIYDHAGNYVEPYSANLVRVKQHPRDYTATQSPGCDNTLGVLVFNFANTYDIYLQDTPEKWLFSKEERDLGHGCVRVENAVKLAATLMHYDGQDKKTGALRRKINRLANSEFVLKNKVPLKITYITCAVGQYGLVTYKDIYDLDNRLEMALYQHGSQLAKR